MSDEVLLLKLNEVSQMIAFERRRTLQKLPAVQDAVARVMASAQSHSLLTGIPADYHLEQLTYSLEYLFDLFPGEPDLDDTDARIESRRDTHRRGTWSKKGRQAGLLQSNRGRSHTLENYQETLAGHAPISGTIAAELLLARLAERCQQWPLDPLSAEVRHPHPPVNPGRDTDADRRRHADEAFGLLVTLFGPLLRRRIVSDLAARHQGSVDDICSSIWMTVFATWFHENAPRKFTGRPNLFIWLLAVAKKRIFDLLRHDYRTREVLENLLVSLTGRPTNPDCPGGEDPEVIQSLARDMLRRAIEETDEIPAGLCALAFSQGENASLFTGVKGGARLLLVSWDYFFELKPMSQGEFRPWRQVELAEKWGVAPASVNQYLWGIDRQQGKRTPGSHEQLLPRVRRMLGMDPRLAKADESSQQTHSGSQTDVGSDPDSQPVV